MNNTELNNEERKLKLKYADFFSGLGAFHTAFDKHNTFNEEMTRAANGKYPFYECVFACDIDPDVRKIYEENYGMVPAGDINKLDMANIPDFDVLCGGFPCQPFSIAGKKLGLDDPKKGNLFSKLMEVIDAKKPHTVFLENVKNLLSINKGQTWKYMESELKSRGYSVSAKVLDSKFHFCPQSRQRIYIVAQKLKPCGEKPENYFDFENHAQFDQTNRGRTTFVPVISIIDRSVNRQINLNGYEPKYELRMSKRYRAFVTKKLEKEREAKETDFVNRADRPMKTYELYNIASGKGGRQGERVYSIWSCGPTICASSGGVGGRTGLYDVDGKIRGLTAHETLGMFGFPLNYKWETLWRPLECRPGNAAENKMLAFLGNSICVRVLEDIIAVLECHYWPRTGGYAPSPSGIADQARMEHGW